MRYQVYRVLCCLFPTRFLSGATLLPAEAPKLWSDKTQFVCVWQVVTSPVWFMWHAAPPSDTRKVCRSAKAWLLCLTSCLMRVGPAACCLLLSHPISSHLSFLQSSITGSGFLKVPWYLASRPRNEDPFILSSLFSSVHYIIPCLSSTKDPLVGLFIIGTPGYPSLSYTHLPAEQDSRPQTPQVQPPTTQY